jgi:hypothetical protein
MWWQSIISQQDSGVGDAGRVFLGNPITEIDALTLLSINSGSYTDVTGIGGIANRLYLTNATILAETDPDTLLKISTDVTAPATNCYGLGGTVDRLFVSSNSSYRLYELDADTLLDITGGGVASPNTSPAGIGGTVDRLYHCNIFSDTAYELDPNTLLQINANTNMIGSSPYGIGGINDTLYFIETGNDRHYIIDKDTLLNLLQVNNPTTAGYAIGGTKVA